MDHSAGIEENKTYGLSYDPMWKEKDYTARTVTWEKDDVAYDICWNVCCTVISSNWQDML